ncbi:PTS sugar transporter subunit IIA [Levilactobacillus tujiorum]|uniref:PTS system fructose subfamily transporter subunit IIA n=1 Tax=Levilactobacillus tujiorum TaxID=2912243 RepID=A0ABX1L9M1_9LACO|nr:PTS system fructose subfamily transporter subunit IIA [Levilactobacillus tujiorum]MCH5464786.1 PTS system fructose subfamily transporter subunit IIA [Levilactobacillus tujiorum]NLR12108.1 PTS system fructose subfamily transporter subunit IIA [Lactobacillus sp. HBUAS51387]NLR29765.1 PTS system fructose subfamily transporter subunit IIA [Levilactobacillus tujiorum]NLR31160.1 PTS system fructose subfamily transporter subunit IIA [Levilactobacillus tujiorum]
MKRAFLVITHGDMGIETVKSMELLMGPQENVKALGLHPGESVDDLRTKVYDILQANEADYDETVLLVDLLGGSPSNVSLSTLAKYHDIKIVTGLSLPLLVNILNFSEAEDNTEKLITDSIGVATEGMKLIDKNFLHQS